VAFLAVLLCTASQTSLAQIVTLTMDDLPFQPVDGLVHPAGVTFGFTVGGVPDLDANYNSGGPGAITFVQDPSIEGTTSGVLELIFATPTPILEFGAARSTVAPLPLGALVELFDASNTPIGAPIPVAMAPLVGFTEGSFVYAGVPVARATVDFTATDPVTGGERFAFDNLTFLVPEPSSIVSTGLGLVGLSLGALRMRARRHGRY
jgi:hypothetical protein